MGGILQLCHSVLGRLDLAFVRGLDLIPGRELLDGCLCVLDDLLAACQDRHLRRAGGKLILGACFQERPLCSGQLIQRSIRLLYALAILGNVEFACVLRKLVDQVLHLPGGLFVFIVGLARRLEAADKLAV